MLLQGERALTWLGPGTVPAAGDDFHWAFTNCWYNDTSSGHDALFNGSIGLKGYRGIIEDEFQRMGAGFDEVFYDNLAIRETVERPGVVFTIDPLDIAE